MILDSFMVKQFGCKGCKHLKDKFTILWRRKKCARGQNAFLVFIDCRTGKCNSKEPKD